MHRVIYIAAIGPPCRARAASCYAACAAHLSVPDRAATQVHPPRWRRAGVPLPAVTVRFSNLAVTGCVAVPEPPAQGAAARLRAGAKARHCWLGERWLLAAGCWLLAVPSLAGLAVAGGCLPALRPSALPCCALQAAVAALTGEGTTRDVAILQGCSGVLRPGRFTLLLGPPGCGKSTLLRALAGRLGSRHAVQVRWLMHPHACAPSGGPLHAQPAGCLAGSAGAAAAAAASPLAAATSCLTQVLARPPCHLHPVVPR